MCEKKGGNDGTPKPTPTPTPGGVESEGTKGGVMDGYEEEDEFAVPLIVGIVVSVGIVLATVYMYNGVRTVPRQESPT